MNFDRTKTFLNYMENNKQLFFPSIQKACENNRELFSELSSSMLAWANNFIGENYVKVLADGYSYFVVDVNKSQMQYEISLVYKNKSYQDVYDKAYTNRNHMRKYHWGVYVTTFAWEHHLAIYKFFKEFFVSKLNSSKINSVLELGSGSGIWGMLVMHSIPDARITGVDISYTSVDISQNMAKINGFCDRSEYVVDDALNYKINFEYDAGISCFLMEHLEEPQELLNNLCVHITTGGYAFVTCALTASEIDHIYEFRKESEVITMAEKAGFRVISALSSAPEAYSPNYKYLPRSMALVLQKRHNSIW